MKDALEREGFALQPAVVPAGELHRLLAVMSPQQAADEPEGHRPAHAARNLLWQRPPLAPELARLGLDTLASEHLGAPAFPISAAYFDKTTGANWKVPGHQDLMMPVEERAETAGFSGWSEKGGVLHVEPPPGVLAKLLALRLHFDDCASSNGALAVVPGSHHRGKLRDADLLALPRDLFVTCEASAGDVLLMRPLLVHRSSAAVSPSHRRVLHVVYASEHPAQALRWKAATHAPR